MRARSRPVPQLPGRHCLSDLPRLPPMPDNKERAAKPATGHLVKQMPNRAYRQSDLYRLFAHACQRLRCFRMHADDDRRDDAMSLDRDLALEVLESGGDRAYVTYSPARIQRCNRAKASCLTFRLLRTVSESRSIKKGLPNALGSPIANALELMIANCANGTQQS